jgi:2-iminoacetate synthase
MENNSLECMNYLDGMEETDPAIMNAVLDASQSYDPGKYTAADVRRALDAFSSGSANTGERVSEYFGALLSQAALPFLEEMAVLARHERQLHFGNSVYLFTPLYIANYCENACVYCGFKRSNTIKRARLGPKEIEAELAAIAKTGLEEVLILTGESPAKSDLSYIAAACELARKYFRVVGLEVYPMDTEGYRHLRESGADFVTVFQETYNPELYQKLHPAGRKRIFPWRFNAQERALMGGIRGIGFAALLGLGDFRRDAFATGLHAWHIQRKYPHAEISFSCPRLRPIINNDKLRPLDVGEPELLQVICAYRLFMPFAGITVSTRENSGFRDNVIGIAATKISAGVDVGIGGHSGEASGDEQFEISDGRGVDEIYRMILNRGLQPVMSDYLYV